MGTRNESAWEQQSQSEPKWATGKLYRNRGKWMVLSMMVLLPYCHTANKLLVQFLLLCSIVPNDCYEMTRMKWANQYISCVWFTDLSRDQTDQCPDSGAYLLINQPKTDNHLSLLCQPSSVQQRFISHPCRSDMITKIESCNDGCVWMKTTQNRSMIKVKQSKSFFVFVREQKAQRFIKYLLVFGIIKVDSSKRNNCSRSI